MKTTRPSFSITRSSYQSPAGNHSPVGQERETVSRVRGFREWSENKGEDAFEEGRHAATPNRKFTIVNHHSPAIRSLMSVLPLRAFPFLMGPPSLVLHAFRDNALGGSESPIFIEHTSDTIARPRSALASLRLGEKLKELF